MSVARFSYSAVYPSLGPAGYMPLLSLNFEYQRNRIADAIGLVDSGATVNVLPYDLGMQLGADWDQEFDLPPLGGVLAGYPARALFVDVTIPPFATVRLMFAWTKKPNSRILLGQVDFFVEFGVCFHRSQLYFEIERKP